MERLTFEGNFCDIAQCHLLPCKYDNSCTQKQVWERLKAYEATELTPKDCAEYREFEDEIIASGKTFARVVELLRADKENRVTILPCKVGDTVWAILDSTKYAMECKVDFVNIGRFNTTIVLYKADGLREQYGVTVAAFGKTVFLTREEAEEALRRAENG